MNDLTFKNMHPYVKTYPVSHWSVSPPGNINRFQYPYRQLIKESINTYVSKAFVLQWQPVILLIAPELLVFNCVTAIHPPQIFGFSTF